MEARRSVARAVPLHVLPAVVALLSVVISIGAWLGTRAVVQDQQARLLNERVAEVAYVLTETAMSVQSSVTALGTVWETSDGSPAAFDRVAAAAVQAGSSANRTAFAVVTPDQGASSFVVRAEAGPALQVGEVLTGGEAATLRAAQTASTIQSTGILGSGAHRRLGFAVGPPLAPPGTVIYRLTELGAVRAPIGATTAPFHELRVILYASDRPDPSQILASTAAGTSLHGMVRSATIPIGSTHWLVRASASQPLVGSVAADAPWVALVVGLCLGALVTALLEYETRRRGAAVARYAAEHDTAEAFQRSLLPALPTVEGLEVAARYVAAQQGHEVGGDWFDVFKLPSGETGVAIGDVVGHDVVAATAMAQIRSALRAYALAGNDPGAVLEHLDELVQTFGITPFVTVFYATLGPSGPEGERRLRYANAGHLPPLVRPPAGPAELLTGGASVVLGAPWKCHREAATRTVAAGTMLLLFTDGLIEVPGVPIHQSLDQLTERLGRLDASLPVDRIASELLPPAGTGIDDIALLALRTVKLTTATPAALAADPTRPDQRHRLV